MPKESVLKLSNMHNVRNGSFYIYKILGVCLGIYI